MTRSFLPILLVALPCLASGRPVVRPQDDGRRPAGAVDLRIDETTTFGALDGGALDADGEVDGVLTVLRNLSVRPNVALLIDVPSAVVLVGGHLDLGEGSRIVPSARQARQGPDTRIEVAGNVVLERGSTLSSDGTEEGGSLSLCAGGYLQQHTGATISASGTGQGARGGVVDISTEGALEQAGRIAASGASGGSVALTSCAPRTGKILLYGEVSARGLSNLGGTIEVESRQSGIGVEAGAVVDATGPEGDGLVRLIAGSRVEVRSAAVRPAPDIRPSSPSLAACSCQSPVLFEDVQLDAFDPLTTALSFEFSGRAPGAVLVEVCSPEGRFEFPVTSDAFVAEVPLRADSINPLFFTAIDVDDRRSAPLATTIISDNQAPLLFVDLPGDTTQVLAEEVDVIGRVGDILSGFMGLTVDVNGQPAEVRAGSGNNGTFIATSVPMLIGSNEIVVTASDALGNTSSTTVSVLFPGEPTSEPRMAIVAGNHQSAVVGDRLGSPLAVRVLDEDGSPFADKVVTFQVDRSNGEVMPLLPDGTPDEGQADSLVQVRTDAEGLARAAWRLGGDAGVGNNRVEARAASVAGSALFCATGLGVAATQLNISSGHNQLAQVESVAPQPLRVWVSDSCNGVEGVDVRFSVSQGGGKVDGFDSIVVPTGSTGHAEVSFLLGPGAGSQHFVTAAIDGEPLSTVVFSARGVEATDGPTRFSGVVIDNASCAIAGAICSIEPAGLPPILVVSGPDGRFELTDLPPGPAHLHVDGTPATAVGGRPITVGTFPALSFEVVLVEGAANELTTPVRLPRLEAVNQRAYSTTADTVLEIDGIDGLRMIISPGSMSIDGVPAPDGTLVSLNQVHADDVPMPMVDGAAPPFSWTLQPPNATYDPPIRIVYPNMSGLPPGAISSFLTFDHDTGRFEIVATGSVAEDGGEIVSDPGSGLSAGGWGCNCPPYSVSGECESCEEPGGLLARSATRRGRRVALDARGDIMCCEDGPVECLTIQPSSLEFGPYTIPIIGTRVPKVTANFEGTAKRQDRCCPGVELGEFLACVVAAQGSFGATVEETFTLNLAKAHPITRAINRFVCDKLERITGGTVTCQVVVGLTVSGASASGRLGGGRNDCTGINGWAGAGTIAVNNIGGTAAISGMVGSVSFSLTLNLTDTISGALVAVGDRMEIRNLGNAGPTVSGELTLPLIGAIPFNRQFTSLRGTLPTGSVPLPPFPSCN